MFASISKSGLELMKQRVLQRVEEQLEQAGIRNEFIESRVNKFEDARLAQLLQLVETLSKALEQVLESATVFHKGVCVLSQANASLRKGVEAASEEDRLRDDAAAIAAVFDESALRVELQRNVTAPVRRRLRHLHDVRNRVKEVEILRLEAATKREAVEKMRVRPSVNAVQLGRGEDLFAEKQVKYEQALLKLMDDFESLQRNSKAILAKAFDSLKTCQYRFVMGATASLGTLCGEDTSAMLPTQAPAAAEPLSPEPPQAPGAGPDANANDEPAATGEDLLSLESAERRPADAHAAAAAGDGANAAAAKAAEAAKPDEAEEVESVDPATTEPNSAATPVAADDDGEGNKEDDKENDKAPAAGKDGGADAGDDDDDDDDDGAK